MALVMRLRRGDAFTIGSGIIVHIGDETRGGHVQIVVKAPEDLKITKIKKDVEVKPVEVKK